MTALHHAAARGDHKTTDFLLDSGADVNSRHRLVGTPICYAALRGHLAVVELLVKYNADLQIIDSNRVGSAMHCACFGGNVPIVKLLLYHGGSLAQRSTVHATSMYSFAEEKSNLSSPSYSWGYSGSRDVNCTPALLAAERCHFELLDLIRLSFPSTKPGALFSASPDSLNSITWEFVEARRLNLQVHPIGTAASSKASADGSIGSDWSFLGFTRPAPALSGATLLMWAAASLKLNLVNYLLKHGAHVRARDSSHKTALFYAAFPSDDAAFNEMVESVQRLTYSGLDVNEASGLLSLLVSPIHPTLDPRITRPHGEDLQAKCISVILEATSGSRQDASYSALCVVLEGGRTYPLHTVEAIRQHGGWGSQNHEVLCQMLQDRQPTEAVVEALLGNDTHLNAPFRGQTALSLAVERKASESIVRLLLNHKADPDLSYEGRRSPRAIAKALRLNRIVSLFAIHRPESASANAKQAASDRSWFGTRLVEHPIAAVPQDSGRSWFGTKLALPSLSSKPTSGSS